MTAPEREIPERLKDFFSDLYGVYQGEPAIYEWDDDSDGLEWVRCMRNPQNVLAFLRKNSNPKDTILAVLNFGDQAVEACRIGVPMEGSYTEIFNTDRERYGGSGMVHSLPCVSEPKRADSRENSIEIQIPALSAVVFKYK
jgi:1,4-alpha-glucan branching enzyme